MPDRTDPYSAFNFRVEVDGVAAGGFTEAGGLVIESEVETFREGGVNDAERQLAGPVKFPSRIVLKRGRADRHDLWDWYRKVASGDVQRKKLAIVQLDYSGEEAGRWSFREACPVKWTGPDLKSQSSSVGFESVELVHRGLDTDS